MRVSEKLKDLSALLGLAGIEDPRREAEEILLLALGIDRARLIAHDPELDAETERRRLAPIVELRLRRVPLQYIAGSVEFMGLTIKVGAGVLIPRPETEFLAEEILKLAAGKFPPKKPDAKKPDAREKHVPRKMKILDLCTGSGCIALALARVFSDCPVDAVDVSEAALRYARDNASINGINNVRFIEGRLFGPVAGNRYDLIVSNPPYIKSADVAGLQPEVSFHEPREALDGGADGLDFYRRILGAAGGFLNAGGLVVLEAGFGQAADIAEIARGAGFTGVRFIADYGGVERILVAHG
jgi:release factor glutamine methyltransferase